MQSITANVTSSIKPEVHNVSQRRQRRTEHTSPNFGEISSNIYEGIVFTQFFVSLPPVTLTFDLITMSQAQITLVNTNRSRYTQRHRDL